MASLKRFLLLPLLVTAMLAAPVDHSSLHTVQARLEASEKTADSLRAQLDQARASASARVEDIRAADETIIHQLRTELDAANERARAAELIGATKDTVIEEVRSQAGKAVQTEAQAKAIAVIAVASSHASDLKQTARHKETIAVMTTAHSDAELILANQRGIERLVADANQRSARVAKLSAERARQQTNTAQLQVIEACGGVLALALLSMILILQIHTRRR